jgi:hypothetical protein
MKPQTNAPSRWPHKAYLPTLYAAAAAAAALRSCQMRHMSHVHHDVHATCTYAVTLPRSVCPKRAPTADRQHLDCRTVATMPAGVFTGRCDSTTIDVSLVITLDWP